MGADAPFLDTNVLVYLLSDVVEKADRAEALVAAGGVVSVQVLNEFAWVAGRKFGRSIPDVVEILAAVRASCRVVDLDVETHDLGLALAVRYRLSIWDGLIVAAAERARCRTLYTEDLNDGQLFGDVRVSNPFFAE